jgi:hypothetical protein
MPLFDERVPPVIDEDLDNDNGAAWFVASPAPGNVCDDPRPSVQVEKGLAKCTESKAAAYSSYLDARLPAPIPRSQPSSMTPPQLGPPKKASSVSKAGVHDLEDEEMTPLWWLGMEFPRAA